MASVNKVMLVGNLGADLRRQFILRAGSLAALGSVPGFSAAVSSINHQERSISKVQPDSVSARAGIDSIPDRESTILGNSTRVNAIYGGQNQDPEPSLAPRLFIKNQNKDTRQMASWVEISLTQAWINRIVMLDEVRLSNQLESVTAETSAVWKLREGTTSWGGSRVTVYDFGFEIQTYVVNSDPTVSHEINVCFYVTCHEFLSDVHPINVDMVESNVWSCCEGEFSSLAVTDDEFSVIAQSGEADLEKFRPGTHFESCEEYMDFHHMVFVLEVEHHLHANGHHKLRL